MNEMVERMANAISKRRAEEVGGCYSDVEECDDTQCKCRDDAIVDARAAIKAMRVPTEQMLVDAGPMDGAWDSETDIDRIHIEWWQAMVDSALTQQ